MTEAFQRFAAVLKVSNRMLEEADPEDLAESCRMLALNVAHYRSRFGDLPLQESLDLLATETITTIRRRGYPMGC
jgi:hypothetical protein